MRTEENNIVNIDGSRFDGHGRNRGRFFSRITPAHIGAAIFLLVFIYLCINLYIFATKDQVSIYEVQAQDLSYDKIYKGICVRDEKLVTSDYAGYINYFIQGGRKCAKSSVVYSVDASAGNIYSELNKGFEDFSLSEDEIREVKSMILSGMMDYTGADISWTKDFKSDLTEMIYDFVSANSLEQMENLANTSTSSSDFHRCRTNASGIVSYKSDNLFGITADGITSETFDIEDKGSDSLRKSGLVVKGDPVYRLCTDEVWSVVVLVSEDFYINNLENRTATVFLNGSATPMTGEMKLIRKDKDYFAQITFTDYMTEYIDTRFVDVEFDYETADGLKIPISSVAQKGYYLIPLSAFEADAKSPGYVLKREKFNTETGETEYEDIYTSKYYTDGYYAYIDMSLLNEGDYIVNTQTGERDKVGTINYLDGVYCVNKGYYVFTRIEKLRSNNEYTIVKSNTPDGLKLYDHIALNTSDAVEGKIIY